MNTQQQIAILNPCEKAEQCSHQRFRSVTKKGQYYVSVILTVNVGEE